MIPPMSEPGPDLTLSPAGVLEVRERTSPDREATAVDATAELFKTTAALQGNAYDEPPDGFDFGLEPFGLDSSRWASGGHLNGFPLDVAAPS